ncbi:MAG TPA: hypothetical protein VK464_18810 [Symbiobacteriaceae bacterium]|nr:hypothetical protein [Symbiobacteriaceae bacterium]
MVLRLRDPLAEGALDLAAQAALAPTLEASLPAPWERCWVVAQPHAWNGGAWAPGLRAVTLQLFNAGPLDTVVDRLQADGDWLERPVGSEPLVLKGHGKPAPVTVALRPQGMAPGMLTGRLQLGGPGWETAVPLQLYVPFDSQPWWQDEVLLLATHLRAEAFSGGQAVTTLTNVGEEPLEVHLESDAPWLEVAPAKLTLRPGQAETVTVSDRLTRLELGAATAHVRVFALPDRKLWAELPVTRQITADMGLPVLAPASLEMSLVGRRAGGRQLQVRNVGGQPLQVRLELPPLVRADWESGSLAPGEARTISVVPENPAAGERAEGSGIILLQTDSGYPALRTLEVPVTIRRLYVVADPAALDLGNVAPHGSQYSPWLKLQLSSGAPGQFAVAVPPEAAPWLEFRSDRLVVRNKPLLGLSGAVSTTVTVQEAHTGAEAQIPVKAFLQRPRLRHSGDVTIKRARPGRRLQQTVRIWDEGQGLQVREVRNMLPWLKVARTAEGLDLQIETGRRERTLSGAFTVETNDPDQPRVRIAVKVQVRPTRWDRLRYDLKEARLLWLLWAVPALLAVIMAVVGGYWWFTNTNSQLGQGGGHSNAYVATPD